MAGNAGTFKGAAALAFVAIILALVGATNSVGWMKETHEGDHYMLYYLDRIQGYDKDGKKLDGSESKFSDHADKCDTHPDDDKKADCKRWSQTDPAVVKAMGSLAIIAAAVGLALSVQAIQAIGANNFDGDDAKFKLGPLVLNLLACLFVAVACIVYATGTMAIIQEQNEGQDPKPELSLATGGILYSVAAVLFFFAGLAAFSAAGGEGGSKPAAAQPAPAGSVANQA